MTLERDIPSTPMMRHVAALLVTAFAVRVGYSALVIWAGGSFETIDSGTYLAIAQDILATGEFARLVDGQVVPITDRMPAYVSLLAAIIWLTGEVDAMSIVVVQAAFDTSTVLATALAARAISPRLTVLAAALGCVWPALVVYTSFILTDSLFVTFFCVGVVWLPVGGAIGAAHSLYLARRHRLRSRTAHAPNPSILPHFPVPGAGLSSDGKIGVSMGSRMLDCRHSDPRDGAIRFPPAETDL